MTLSFDPALSFPFLSFASLIPSLPPPSQLVTSHKTMLDPLNPSIDRSTNFSQLINRPTKYINQRMNARARASLYYPIRNNQPSMMESDGVL
jgi:hypothetical protein